MVIVPKRANLAWELLWIYQLQFATEISPVQQAHFRSLSSSSSFKTTPAPWWCPPSTLPPTMASRRRTLQIFLAMLALILVGTVVVLSSISVYLSIDNAAYLTEDEVGYPDGDATWNATAHGKVERIPRILHQTWKSETLPDRWKDISQECRDMMHD